MKAGEIKTKQDWTGNSKSTYITLGASNHTDEDREENDFYATDPIAIDKLLTVETPNKNIWECAVGGGSLAYRLREKGYEVLGSDIINRGFPETWILDFLKMTHKFNGDILTNPPYAYALEFILKALELIEEGSKVYMFLKVQFLEGKKRKRELFDKFPPKTVYIFSERILCAKNAEFERMKAGGGSAVAYAWYVWEKGYVGDTIIKWI